MARSKVVMTVLAAAAALAAAGCGSVTAADAGHVSAASGHASATTRPSGGGTAAASPEAVNPGGPLRPVGGVSGLLCSAPGAASQVFILRMGVDDPVLPSGPRVSAFLTSATPPSADPVVKGAVQARALAQALCALPTVTGGILHCPQQVTAGYRLTFTAGGRLLPVVIVRPSGCPTVTGAGAVRSAARGSAFLQLLASMAGPLPLPGAVHLPGAALSGGSLHPVAATRG